MRMGDTMDRWAWQTHPQHLEYTPIDQPPSSLAGARRTNGVRLSAERKSRVSTVLPGCGTMRSITADKGKSVEKAFDNAKDEIWHNGHSQCHDSWRQNRKRPGKSEGFCPSGRAASIRAFVRTPPFATRFFEWDRCRFGKTNGSYGKERNQENQDVQKIAFAVFLVPKVKEEAFAPPFHARFK